MDPNWGLKSNLEIRTRDWGWELGLRLVIGRRIGLGIEIEKIF